MQIFRVHAQETGYYREEEIEAETAEEAQEIYQQMVENENVPVVNSDFKITRCEAVQDKLL